MTEFVKEWSGTAASIREALELADQRGQLVSYEPLRADGRGVAVRVVLQGVELPPAPPAGQRRTAGGRRTVVKWVAVAASAALVVGVVASCVIELAKWASGHVAQIVGWAVVILIGAAVLARIVVGRGGDEHPCNR